MPTLNRDAVVATIAIGAVVALTIVFFGAFILQQRREARAALERSHEILVAHIRDSVRSYEDAVAMIEIIRCLDISNHDASWRPTDVKPHDAAPIVVPPRAA